MKSGGEKKLEEKVEPWRVFKIFSSLLMSTSELRKYGHFFRIGVNKKGKKLK